MGFFANLFDDNAKDIKKYTKVVEEINALEPGMGSALRCRAGRKNR